ncbi:GNAT family N-acetyltransferase [Frankia sp. CNm7]|uniref:GNAT family N-acetyltransferase n=1 Tax=Frankia nepalensis TaxID=1836974 RepID=A0A937RAY3_9ACTN|nr:GNAT family N-acetyltransferase [Frankia nepalensis]MBL7496138.1 GNAT family N-acetyltransferase [Frankia nepalensis]MBL7508923.1 GNAT family N-acetyltransferase [Frankia nepalensis]MBL7516763.1 GNAT family N-acetyltransferase [Frankia nepalensis]MBL7628701.1 GNAT family N-acetyltransferase [Frankia nepalensis]
MTLTFGTPDVVTIPTVLTPRMVLRGWRGEDVEPYLAMAGHPDMSRYTGSPSTTRAVWGMTAFQIGHWALNGFGMWIARDKESGEFLGRAGLYEEYGWPDIEVAWTIRRDRWGQGYATEGGAAALEFAFTQLGHPRDRVISIIHPENAASIRVAEKLGLTLAEGPIDRGGDLRNIYEITRETWEKQANLP